MGDLSHLTEIEIESLMKRYYEGEKIENLIKEYRLNITSPGHLFQMFPPIVLPEISCRYCNVSMIRKRPSKNGALTKPYCLKCGCFYINSERSITNCECSNCLKLRRKAYKKTMNRQLANLDIFFKNEAEKASIPYAVSEFDLIDGIFMIILVRALADESMEFIRPLNTASTPIAPTFEFSRAIIKHLLDLNIIYVHRNSPREAFSFSVEDEITGYTLPMCCFGLNLGNSNNEIIKNYADLESKIEGTISSLIDEKFLLEYKDDPLVIMFNNDLFELRRKLALHECIEYLAYQADQHGFSYQVGEKTTHIFLKILDNFSVSQVYSFIWNSIKNATAFQARNRVSKKHAANTIPGSCLSSAERALNNSWEVKGYRRDFGCPRSMLSIVLYEQLLKKGDSGFTEIYSVAGRINLDEDNSVVFDDKHSFEEGF